MDTIKYKKNNLENAKEESVNDIIEKAKEGIQKKSAGKAKGGFYEFIREVDKDDLADHVVDADVADDNPQQSFVEFIEKKDVTISGVNTLFNSFFSKKRWLKDFISWFYGSFIFYIDLVIDAFYILFKKKSLKDRITIKKSSKEIKIEDIDKSFTKDKKIKDNKVLMKDSLKEGGKNSIQFKTLLLLSKRMFTSGSSRTILTILGISISIGVILFLISFGYGLQRTVLQRITTEDALLSLSISMPDDSFFDAKELEDMRNIKEIEKLSSLVEYKGNVWINDSQIDTTIFITNKDYFSLSGLMGMSGNPISLEKENISVSSGLAALLGFDRQEIIGSTVFLTPTFRSDSKGGMLNEGDLERLDVSEKTPFMVKDVIEDDLDVFAYVLEIEFPDLEFDSFAEVKVKVHNKEQLTFVQEELVNRGYLISSISDTVDETRKIFRIIQFVLGFFGLIALIISAIGMLNILTIVLLERTQEIGIMKSIGASDKDVWKMVIFDAVIIGFLGGVGGSAIGVLASKTFNFAFSILAQRIGGQAVEIFQSPPGFILTIIVFSSFIGFATGIWPAIRASRISPLEAIRYK